MTEMTPIRGELQIQVMAVVWRSGGGTVEEIRARLPSRYRGAYTTVQTVLNRLAERGLLDRTRAGQAYRYDPGLTEAEYLSQSIERTLAGASSPARQAALIKLMGELDRDELQEVQRLAEEAESRRRGRDR